MFQDIKGELIGTEPNGAVIECGGIGYKFTVSANTVAKLASAGDEVCLYTYLCVREDALDLFGFCDERELDMFRMITNVSGVGPKVAMSILSEFEPDRLSLFIASGDSKSITRAAGVGGKLAQRIVLELKDKIGAAGLSDSGEVASVAAATVSGNTAEAVEALVSLGYSQSEAALAVGKLDHTLPVETLIKEGLKALARF